MKIKEAKYKKVKTWKNELISEEVYGCDYCKKEIDMTDTEQLNYLTLKVFRNKTNTRSEYHQFCSWVCVLRFLPTVKSDYFVDLPYLSYDNKKVGTRAKDFIKLLPTNQ